MALKAGIPLLVVALAGLVMVAIGMWQAWYPLGLIVGGLELVAVAYVAQNELGGYLARRK